MTGSRAPVAVLNGDAAVSLCPLPFHAGADTSQSNLGTRARPPSPTPSLPPGRLWLCTFTLSVAACAVLLLPISILSNEVLLSFPQSYYMQWLNGSLIHGTFFMVLWMCLCVNQLLIATPLIKVQQGCAHGSLVWTGWV